MMPRRAMLLLALCAAVAYRAPAQGIGAEVLGTVELWKTDPGSRLLALNDGNPMVLGRF
jgi:hypothetical protein